MALDTDNVVVAADGRVYVGPVGTPAPTNVTDPLNAAFVDLGLINEDGISRAPNMDTVVIRSWQLKYPARTIVTERSLEYTFTLQEWKDDVMEFAEGGATVTVTGGTAKLVPPDPSTLDFRALVIEWEDGAKKFREIGPKVLLTSLAEHSLTSNDAAVLPVTVAIQGTDGTDPWYRIWNVA